MTKEEVFNGIGNNLQLVVSYEDLKRVCADLYNEERIRQEKIKESDNDGMLSAKQAMDMLGVKAETLWRWHNRGYLCHVKVGNRNYYKRCDLERILRKEDVN